jgi:uncharacterized damage-inducible protein DinB
MANDDLRYPIGRYVRPGPLTDAARAPLIAEIAAAPSALRRAVLGLDDRQLDTPYRPGGWTVRQVVHHLPDSHVNAYVRFKLALTEDMPTIRPYDEKLWAELPEARTAPVAMSLDFLDGVHGRWVAMLRAMDSSHFARVFVHPESGRMTLDDLLALYAWHGKHHTTQITALRAREGWA